MGPSIASRRRLEPRSGQALPDRLPPIAASELTPAQRGLSMHSRRARRRDQRTVLSAPAQPELMTRTRAMGDYLRYKSALPPRLSEFRNSPDRARGHGTRECALSDRGQGRRAARRTRCDRANGRRPTGMIRRPDNFVCVLPGTASRQGGERRHLQRALKAFGEQGVVDTVGITGYYTLWR
jgi:4-carboxymuconolactone decarboxylase